MNRYDLEKWSDEEVKKLADMGNYTATYEYGERLYFQKLYKESFKYLYSLVNYNNFLIWERIIDIVYNYEKDLLSDKELFNLLLRRHQHGSSYYSYILADFYKEGRGTRRSLKKYIELLIICSNDGSASATQELAECYEKGFGVKKSLRKAFKTYYYYYDEHGKKDYWCSYKVALYMLNEWGGAKKDMGQIRYYLEYAARVVNEARELYIELFNEDPVPDKPRKL